MERIIICKKGVKKLRVKCLPAVGCAFQKISWFSPTGSGWGHFYSQYSADTVWRSLVLHPAIWELHLFACCQCPNNIHHRQTSGLLSRCAKLMNHHGEFHHVHFILIKQSCVLFFCVWPFLCSRDKCGCQEDTPPPPHIHLLTQKTRSISNLKIFDKIRKYLLAP